MRVNSGWIVFAAVFAIHTTSPVSIQGDSRWTIPQALSLIHQRNFALDEYAARFPAQDYYFVECVSAQHVRTYPVKQATCPDGHFYYRYPVSMAIVAAPFVVVMQAALYVLHPALSRFPDRGVVGAFFNGDLVTGAPVAEIVIASFFVAAAAAILFLVLREILALRQALAATFVFAFCTPAWSTASRALFQHAPSMFVNCLLLLVVFRAVRRPALLWMVGPLAALNFFIRPTNAVPALVLGIFVLWRAPRQAIWGALAGAPVIAIFVALSYRMYGFALAPYFYVKQSNASAFALQPRVFEALAGNLVSPARGLLVFCPFLVLLFLPVAWRAKLPIAVHTVRPWLIAIVALQWLLVSTYRDWVGGFCYGPRYMCDVIPYLMVLMAPVFYAVFEPRAGIRLDRVIFGVLIAAALFIHARGAYSIAVHDWNSKPVNINEAQWRVWDWRDPPFLR